MDIVSTKMTNTVATNVWINCHDEKVRYKMDCYILHTVLLVIILLLITTIIIIMQGIGQNRKVLTDQQYKNGEYKLKKVRMKIVGVIISMT